MTADRLLRLYPRWWRDRYGEEFLALVGGRPLNLAQVIDIVSGAIDARLSSDVRASASAERRNPAAQGGTAVIQTLTKVCGHNRNVPFSVRDSLIGAGVIVLGSIVLSAAGVFLDQSGFETAGEALKDVAFPGALTLSMPFTWTRGQPWKAQVVIVGGTLAIFTFAIWLATRL
jgi:hypothetical protein